MNDSSNNTGENSPTYSPKTSQERDEAFRLLSELEKESARQQAFWEALTQQLAGLDPPVPSDRKLSPEEEKKFAQNWGKFLHPERQAKE